MLCKLHYYTLGVAVLRAIETVNSLCYSHQKGLSSNRPLSPTAPSVTKMTRTKLCSKLVATFFHSFKNNDAQKTSSELQKNKLRLCETCLLNVALVPCADCDWFSSKIHMQAHKSPQRRTGRFVNVHWYACEICTRLYVHTNGVLL